MTIILDGTTGITTPAINSSGDLELPGGTANGVLYLNGSKVATSGSALVFDGTNMGLGVTPSAWATNRKVLQVQRASLVGTDGNETNLGANYYWDGSNNKYIASAHATLYNQGNGLHVWYTAPSGTAGNTITFTQAMTLTAAGALGIGTASPSGELHVKAASAFAEVYVQGASSTSGMYLFDNNTEAGMWKVDSGYLAFGTTNTERARITAAGDFLFNGTTSNAANCITLNRGGGNPYIWADSDNESPLYINRRASDGNLVQFYQDTLQEGTISVSGNTVSYNAFAGSHWSQLQDGSKPDILRGTVMESINELCEWPGESNERLPKCKISDTAGSKKVYGVFMAWDNDWETTNDMYVTAVGAFVCRVNAGVTVQEGDLLESNGDGTARVQADDLIRSSTIGKVTSTVKTHEYDDGSYCVPTVLYCG